MSSIDTHARAIFNAHQATFFPASASASASAAEPQPDYSRADPVYQAAKRACLRLGFIPIDAECLALAWQAQTTRTGQFDACTWPDTPADFGLAPRPRANAFAPCPERLGLYAVLPDAAWVGRMARIGVPTTQLRFKSDDATAVAREVQAAVAAVQGTSSLLFINDHWRAAIDAGAYGLHLGQEDLDALQPAELLAIRQSGIRLGVSTHGYAEMLRADAVSPSYIAMGAVFPTTLKKMATAPQGLGRLYAYARLLRGTPLVAIGGIDAAQMPAVVASGVGSVAVVRALVQAPNPELAAIELKQILASSEPV